MWKVNKVFYMYCLPLNNVLYIIISVDIDTFNQSGGETFMEKVAFNISEAAEMMGISKNTVIRLIKDGKLPAKRPGSPENHHSLGSYQRISERERL